MNIHGVKKMFLSETLNTNAEKIIYKRTNQLKGEKENDKRID